MFPGTSVSCATCSPESAELISSCWSSAPVRDAAAITRLPIDRVFTMKGFGTVVTGTLIAGTIRRDDELELFPANRHVRARAVQVHGTSAEQAIAGQRTAVNLAGIEK